MKKIKNISIIILTTLCIVMVVCLNFNDASSVTTENKVFSAPIYYTETKNSTIKIEWDPYSTYYGPIYNISIHYVDENGNPILPDAELQKLIDEDDQLSYADKKLPIINGTNLYLDHLKFIKVGNFGYSYSHILYGDFEDGVKIKQDIYAYNWSDYLYYNLDNGVSDDLWYWGTEYEMDANSDIYIVYNRNVEYSVDGNKFVVDWKLGETNYKINVHYVDIDGKAILTESQLKDKLASDTDMINLPEVDGTNLGFDQWRDINATGVLGDGYLYEYVEMEISGKKTETKQVIYTYENGTKSNKLYYNVYDGVHDDLFDVATEKELPSKVDVYIVYQPYPYYTIEDGLYTMKWYVNNDAFHTFKFHFVDEAGNEVITGEDVFDIAPRKESLTDYMLNTTKEVTAKNGKKYVFKNAQLENGQLIKPIIYSIMLDNDLYYNTYSSDYDGVYELWLWDERNQETFSDLENDIYLVYTEKKELNKIETIDNYAAGFDMYMFNYTYDQIYSINGMEEDYKTGEGTLTYGLYSRVLENGYPIIAETGESLEPLYNISNGVRANSLFSKKVYDEEGLLYYNSSDNFAQFNEKTGNFEVYDVLGSPNDSDHFFYQRGNFMPYNTLDNTKVVNYNWYDETGMVLSESDSKTYGKEIYGFKEENDFYFGLYGEGEFTQSVNGIYNGNPMNVTIVGDDDYLVYIDDVLVMELAGAHDAQKATLDLSTGEIYWSNNSQTSTDMVIESTTLKEIYNSLEDEELKETLAAKGWSATDDTFVDGSKHEIKVFYMERGDSAASFEVNLNLDMTENDVLGQSKNPNTIDMIIVSVILFVLGVVGAVMAYRKVKWINK